MDVLNVQQLSNLPAKMFKEVEDSGHVRVQSDSSVIHKRIVHEGLWGTRATENAVVKILIKDVKCSGVSLQNLQESSTLSQLLSPSPQDTLTIGDVDSVIDKALERCVQSMLEGETSIFVIRLPSLTNIKQEECSTYPYVIECSIKMENITKESPVCEWTNEKLFKIALHHKNEGVKLFKCGRKIESFLRFSKSFKFLNIVNIDLSKDPNAFSLKIALLNNMANCQLEFQNYLHAISLCCKVLFIDPNNIKSLYRRAMAFMNIKKFDEAKDDLQKILQLEPSNGIAKEKYGELKVKMKEKEANYAAVIKKMFSS